MTYDRMDAVTKLLEAEAHYLLTFGWRPIAPIAPGAPSRWRDHLSSYEWAQDEALRIQKARDIDIFHMMSRA